MKIFAPSILTTLVAAFLVSPKAGAQGAPPLAPAAEEQIQLPDSSGWNTEQAVVNLRSSDKGTRLAALRRLAMEPGPAIQKWIAESAQYDPEPRIRFEAVKILEMRKEQESLPVLMYLGENDRDDRVRTAAKTAAGLGQPAPGAPPPSGQPGAAQPKSAVRYDADGNELPPGLDNEPAGPGGAGGDEWSTTVDMSEVQKNKKEEKVHFGFLPQLGYDGPIGAPRDTAMKSGIGLQLGYGRGVFTRNLSVTDSVNPNTSEAFAQNEFTSSDFSLLLTGRYSPVRFFEIGVELEALTVEKTAHRQRVTERDNGGDWEDEPLTKDPDAPEYVENVYQDGGYGGAAFGLIALDLKTVFVDKDILKLGLAVRVAVPTHTGSRFDEGLGASDLFLLSSDVEREVNVTRDGRVWTVEPGVVMSVAPVAHFSVYADVMFLSAFLSYTRHMVEIDDNGADFSTDNELKTVNLYLIPHIGAQYRFLDDSLGLQVALSPAIYLGKSAGAGLAGFGITPGIIYRVKDAIDLALTVDFQLGADATKPFECTDLTNGTSGSGTTPCGVGRVFGMDLSVGYDF